MSSERIPTTRLCRSTSDRIEIRGKDLCEDLIGKVDLTEMMVFEILGRMPTQTEARILTAVMVAVMEHGINPSTISARLVYSSAPEALQGAVSAGLLAAGSVLLGTVEQCARLLERLVLAPEGVQAAARREAEACKAAGTRISGFGHPWHYPVDPRTPRLFALARELGLPCTYVDAAEILSTEVDAVYGRHLTMNASTAFAALLKEIDIPVEIMRGFVLVARTASLVAHIYEEQRDRSAWTMMMACEEAVPYRTE